MGHTYDEERDEYLEVLWHVAAAKYGIKQVLREGDGADSDDSGSPDDDLRVESQECEQVAVRLHNVEVVAAGTRHERAHLRVAQRAEPRDHAAEHPDAEREAHAAHL